MRILLFLAVLTINCTGFAKEITVMVIEGWKSKPVPKCEITLKSNVGKVLFVVETNAQGKVDFSDLSYGIYTVEASKVGNDFLGTTYTFKLTKDAEVKLILRPSMEYTSQQRAWEDSIYGKAEPPKEKVEEGESESESESESEGESEGEGESESEGKDEEEWIDAQFPGGTSEMMRFIKDNLIYPEISQELGDQGRVYVVFIVEPDGVLTHVSIYRGLSQELDEEAKRLIRAMPTWIPSSVDGENVRTRCRLPLTFTLE